MSTSGIGVDRNFDIEFNSSGDVRITDAVSELEKDLSFRVARLVDRAITGQVLRANDRARLESRIETVVSSDSRISGVRQVTVSMPSGSGSTPIIRVEAQIGDGSITLTFPQD